MYMCGDKVVVPCPAWGTLPRWSLQRPLDAEVECLSAKPR